METRDIPAFIGRSPEFGDDLVERHRRRIDDARTGGAIFEQRLGHERTRIQADRTTGDEIASAQGNEIRRAGSGADEMNRHDPSPMAIAQVTLFAATRAPSSRAFDPAATSADASAIDGMPLISWTRNERVRTRSATRPRSAIGHRTTGSDSERAAPAMPRWSAFEVSVAIAVRFSRAMP